MPPHQPKKPRTLRQQQLSEEQEADQISSPIAPSTGASSQETGVSPTKPNGQLEKMMENIVVNQRAQHKARKQSVIESYEADLEAAETAVATLFDAHEESAETAHRAQIQALRDLLAEKVRVEEAMQGKLAELRAGYEASSRDLEAVLVARIKGLQ